MMPAVRFLTSICECNSLKLMREIKHLSERYLPNKNYSNQLQVKYSQYFLEPMFLLKRNFT